MASGKRIEGAKREEAVKGFVIFFLPDAACHGVVVHDGAWEFCGAGIRVKKG